MCIKTIPRSQGEVKILLTSLSVFLEREISGERTMNQEAKEQIRNLYKNEKNHSALALIRDYKPIHEITIELEYAVNEEFNKIAPGEKPSWCYWPDSISPQEIKMVFKKLDERTSQDKCWFIYMLLRANKGNPSVGDSYTMLVAIWYEKNSKERAINIARSLADKLKFPIPQIKNWNGWEILWQGDNYSLQDFGEKDVDGLKSIFMKALEETYSPIMNELGHLS